MPFLLEAFFRLVLSPSAGLIIAAGLFVGAYYNASVVGWVYGIGNVPGNSQIVVDGLRPRRHEGGWTTTTVDTVLTRLGYPDGRGENVFNVLRELRKSLETVEARIDTLIAQLENHELKTDAQRVQERAGWARELDQLQAEQRAIRRTLARDRQLQRERLERRPDVVGDKSTDNSTQAEKDGM